MVYIRPSNSVVLNNAIKPVAGVTPTHDDHSLASDDLVNEYLARPHRERRRQQHDRRQARQDALLETRVGRDRRKSKPSISLSV